MTWHVWRYQAPRGHEADLGPFTLLVRHLPLGVTLLFVLSAFLLYRPFAAAIIREQRRPSLRMYFVNRAQRILPAYWAIFLLVLAAGATLIRTEPGELRYGRMDDPLDIGLNLLDAQSLVPHGLLTGVGPAWALTAVVTFYLALPLLVLLAAALAASSRGAERRVLASLAPATLLMLVRVGTKLVLLFWNPATSGGWGADWPSVLERSFFAHADMFEFALALALAVLHVAWLDGCVTLPGW